MPNWFLTVDDALNASGITGPYTTLTADSLMSAHAALVGPLPTRYIQDAMEYSSRILREPPEEQEEAETEDVCSTEQHEEVPRTIASHRYSNLLAKLTPANLDVLQWFLRKLYGNEQELNVVCYGLVQNIDAHGLSTHIYRISSLRGTTHDFDVINAETAISSVISYGRTWNTNYSRLATNPRCPMPPVDGHEYYVSMKANLSEPQRGALLGSVYIRDFGRCLSHYGATLPLEVAYILRYVYEGGAALNSALNSALAEAFSEELDVLNRIFEGTPVPTRETAGTRAIVDISLKAEDFPVETLTDKPASIFELEMQKGIAESLSLDCIPLVVVRSIIANAEFDVYVTDEEPLVAGVTCLLCGRYRSARRNLCTMCENSFKKIHERARRPLTMPTSLANTVTQLRDLHRIMKQGRLLEYSTRCPVAHAQPSYVGIELELEGPNTGRFAKIIADNGLLGIAKQDGSLQSGAEFVTIPLPKKKAEEEITRFCALARENNFKARHTCGMHIHLNREGFEDIAHIARFHHLFNGRDDASKFIMPIKFLKAYVGVQRYNKSLAGTGYARRGMLTGIRITDEGVVRAADRYAMVSLSPIDTVEVRFFAATTNESKARANIQFVIAAREYTRNTKNVSWKGLRAFVRKNEQEYSDFYERLARFDTVTSEEIAQKQAESTVTVETVL